MIVRDEKHTLPRCIASVRPFVSGWVIVDTGSVDGTQCLARAMLNDIPGMVVNRAWSGDFARHRNDALEITRYEAIFNQATHILTIDADEWLTEEGALGLATCVREGISNLFWYASADEYCFRKAAVLNIRDLVKWSSALHEFPVLRSDAKALTLGGVSIEYGDDGYRRRHTDWVANDLRTLSEKSAQDWRNLFFFARTHEAANSFSAARTGFIQSARLATNEDELFQAGWGALRCAHYVGLPLELQLSEANDLCDVGKHPRNEVLLHAIGVLRSLGRLNEAHRHLDDLADTTSHIVGTSMFDKGAYSWRPYVVRADFQRESGASTDEIKRTLNQALHLEPPPAIRSMLLAWQAQL